MIKTIAERKQAWLAACVDQYIKHADLGPDDAAMAAAASWDLAVENEGSEEAASMSDPVEYANEEMECWES